MTNIRKEEKDILILNINVYNLQGLQSLQSANL